jgi:hypothetical protein
MRRSTTGGFRNASSEFKAVGAFFCNFVTFNFSPPRPHYRNKIVIPKIP